MKETRELVNALFDTVEVSVEHFADGIQWSDIAAIIPLGLAWNVAIEGVKEAFRAEALETNIIEVGTLFNSQTAKLTTAGLDPFLAEMLVTEIKGKYLLYAYAVRKKDTKEDTD